MRIILTLLLAFTAHITGYASYSYSEKARSVHGLIHTLHLEEAKESLEALSKDEGAIGFYYYLDQFQDALRILISQDQSAYKPYIERCKSRMAKAKELQGSSAWKNYCLAEMEMYEALIHAKFNQMKSAASSVSTAYNLLEENEKKHPDFLPTYKTLGLLEAGIGTLPEIYQKMIGILGYTGSINKGYVKLKKATNTGNPELIWIEKEAGYLQMVIELYLLNDREKAWQTIDLKTKDHSTNLLATFFRANTAMKCGKNDEAIRTLESRPGSGGVFLFPFLDYLLGTAKLNKLDPGALKHLEAFVREQEKGDYVKSAYHKLSWYYLIFSNPDKYDHYRNLTISRGNITLEADKQALFEVLDEPQPHPELLKVRCLFDGGYYQRALEIAKPMREAQFDLLGYKIEYNYRKGRIYQMLGDTAVSRPFYLEAIKRGKDSKSKSYYVAYSAYYLGEIYEERGNKPMARKYYIMAKELGKSTNFKKSIEHKAKSALARL